METLRESHIVPSVSDLRAQIDQLRVDIFADFPPDDECFESEQLTASTDPTVLDRELSKARDRIGELEAALAKSGSHADDEVARLESRVRELVERESQLNGELEHVRLADHRRTLEQNHQVLVLRAEVDAMRRSESSLRERLSETTERCEEQLTQAKSDNSTAVSHVTSLLHDNQSQLLTVLTDLNSARRQLEITAGKLDERSAQLDDAVQQLRMAEESMDEMRQSNSELRQQVGEAESMRDLMSTRLAAYESSAVDGGIVGADVLVRQTCELEKQIADRDGRIIQLQSAVMDLKLATENGECREEALAAENVRLQQELDCVTSEQLKTTAELQGKVQLFEQVMTQKDREISTLRSELSSPAAARMNQLPGSCFAKIVAASTEPDADRRMSRLQDIFREMSSTHAKQVSSLNEQLDQATEDLQLFKQHAKKQFEAHQEKVTHQ